MKITLYNAISADGFIARSNTDTDWVVDIKDFEKACQDAGCLFIGRKTYEEIGVVEGAINIVLSKNSFLRNKNQNVIFAKSTDDAIKIGKDKGFESIILAGGATTNAAFMKKNKIDEVVLRVHPIFLGSGINIFNNGVFDSKLELVSSNKKKNGLVYLKYKVVKE